jgi:hypothetical protein
LTRKANTDAKPIEAVPDEEKFAKITRCIKWAYDRTRNPGLECLEVSAGPEGVVLSGEASHTDEWMAGLIARQHARGLSVISKVRLMNGNGKK